MGIWEISAWQLVLKGGPLVIPIILCSLFAVTIIIEKMLYLSSISVDVLKLKERIFTLVRTNKLKEAVSVCEDSKSPVAKVLKAGILRIGSTKEVMREALEDAGLFEIPKLEGRLTALSTIANVSPLIGLLGTVTGMAGSFHTISIQTAATGPVTPGDLAGGIWEALLTTVFGLAVAIPAFVAHSYFVSCVNKIVLQIEHAGAELLQLSEELNVAIVAGEGA